MCSKTEPLWLGELESWLLAILLVYQLRQAPANRRLALFSFRLVASSSPKTAERIQQLAKVRGEETRQPLRWMLTLLL